MLLHSAIVVVAISWVEKLRRHFFRIFGGTRVPTDPFLHNFTATSIIVIEKRSIQIDIALSSVLRGLRPVHCEIVPVLVRLQLSLDFLSGKLVLPFECLVRDPKKGDDFGRPEELVLGHFVAEAFQVLDEADDLVGVLLVQRLARQSLAHHH